VSDVLAVVGGKRGVGWVVIMGVTKYFKGPNSVPFSRSPSLNCIRGEMPAGVKHDNETLLEKNNLYPCPVTFLDRLYCCCNYGYSVCVCV